MTTKASIARRAVLLGTGAAAGYLAGRAWTPRLPGRDGMPPRVPGAAPAAQPGPPLAPGMQLNDASELQATPIILHTQPRDHGDALIETYRAVLAEARAEGHPVCVSAARHSMGGHAIPRAGHAITVTDAWIDPDTTTGTYRVNGGARWRDVIAALDPLGFSPAVMQSNHDFGVAATFSVGAHGWPVPYGPMGQTVRSLRMVLPDGTLVTCSRAQNADLFAAAMGGYGLVGLIVDLEVEMVPNLRLTPAFDLIDAQLSPTPSAPPLTTPAPPMAYGRLNVDRAGLGAQALLVRYRPSADQTDLPPAAGSGWTAHLAARIYRAQTGREGMKRLRWWIESGLAPRIAGDSTRNSLMNEPIETLADGDPARVDILHEYFVPFQAFDGFLSACQDVIRDAFVEFLNVTLRFVDSDPDSLLAHSPGPASPP